MYKKDIVPPPRSRRATNPTPDRPEGGYNIFLYIFVFFCTCLAIL